MQLPSGPHQLWQPSREQNAYADAAKQVMELCREFGAKIRIQVQFWRTTLYLKIAQNTFNYKQNLVLGNREVLLFLLWIPSKEIKSPQMFFPDSKGIFNCWQEEAVLHCNNSWHKIIQVRNGNRIFLGKSLCLWSILPFSTTKAQMRDLQIQCIISGQTANLFIDSLVFVNWIQSYFFHFDLKFPLFTACYSGCCFEYFYYSE